MTNTDLSLQKMYWDCLRVCRRILHLEWKLDSTADWPTIQRLRSRTYSIKQKSVRRRPILSKRIVLWVAYHQRTSQTNFMVFTS